MPESLQKYMDSCRSSDRGKVLKVLADLTDSSSFEDAMHAVTQAVMYNATDPDSLMNLYRKICSDVPQLPPMQNMNEVPGFGSLPANTDLTAYDAIPVSYTHLYHEELKNSPTHETLRECLWLQLHRLTVLYCFHILH